MVQEYTLRVLPPVAADGQALRDHLSREKGLDPQSVTAVRILRRSIDARQRTVVVNLTLRVYLNETPPDEDYRRTTYPDVTAKPPVVVVGAGPGGLFAALRLIELGLRPILLERGKDVRERKKDLARISRQQSVDPESNYSFGEGGAGAYSDGKLYTRSKKRGNVDKILSVFCQHGAPTSILMDVHPHIGTDKLPRVIENIRKTILQCGGEVHFQTRMDALLMDADKVIGVETHQGETFLGPVVLATGHSARDVYRWLAAHNVEMEPKGIAVGVRLEHPARLIDRIQYHSPEGRGKYLPAAEYSFVTQADGRGVYSFCMCPGGFVVPAATDAEQVVVNGMSPSNRGSKWANSGMVVEVRPEDLPGYAGFGKLAVMEFQKDLERTAWLQGGMSQVAPAQRMADFVNRKLSAEVNVSSYTPGLVASPLHFWLPDFVAGRLSQAFVRFGKTSKGFLTNEANLIGVETRTSSPVRILRDADTLQHVSLPGLFPCGEGAGYAGGIVSAAIDGERCAEMLADYIQKIR